MSKMHEVFANARAENRAALIAYLPSGFPDQAAAISAIECMVDNGVDIVEIGLPYSDPLMDGPTIQDAVVTSLGNGSTTGKVIETVAAVARTGAPTLVMSYWNPIEKFGVNRFAAELAQAGGVGVITPDLTPEEADSWMAATDRENLDRVFLVAPSSTDARLRIVCHATTGFVYAASTMGVTGARTAVSHQASDLVKRTRAVTTLPISVGLGVSSGEQAAEIAQFADGVIVGSAFVRALLDAPSTAEGISAVGKLAADLAAGVRRRSE
jgi:tryptophan synthase alpha chain